MTRVLRAYAGLLVGLALVASTAAPSRASLTLSGDIVQIAAPADDRQGHGDPQSNDHAFIWSERTGLTLSSAVSVDMTTTGTSDSSNSFQPSPGTIATGTFVDTYLIHSDPIGSGAQNYVFSVTFSSAILGIIDTKDGLAATDSALGSPSTIYPGASRDRGLEGTDALVWVSNNGLTLNFTTSAFVDEARVIVVGTPEPSTMISGAMGLASLVGFGWVRRRRGRPSPEVA